MGLPGNDALAAFCCSKEEGSGDFTPELRRIVELSAGTGKYWHDWRLLKQLLHFRLNQVLKQLHGAAIPSGNGNNNNSLNNSNEKFLYEVLNKLGQQLSSFTDAAPFTLQRICELLLSEPTSYSSLDKFDLAFEKLLLVTSTFPPSSPDSYPDSASPASNDAGTTMAPADDTVAPQAPATEDMEM